MFIFFFFIPLLTLKLIIIYQNNDISITSVVPLKDSAARTHNFAIISKNFGWYPFNKKKVVEWTLLFKNLVRFYTQLLNWLIKISKFRKNF